MAGVCGVEVGIWLVIRFRGRSRVWLVVVLVVLGDFEDELILMGLE